MSRKNWVGPTFSTNRAARRAEEKAARKRQNGLKAMQRQMREAAEARKAAALEAEQRVVAAGPSHELAWIDEAVSE